MNSDSDMWPTVVTVALQATTCSKGKCRMRGAKLQFSVRFRIDFPLPRGYNVELGLRSTLLRANLHPLSAASIRPEKIIPPATDCEVTERKSMKAGGQGLPIGITNEQNRAFKASFYHVNAEGSRDHPCWHFKATPAERLLDGLSEDAGVEIEPDASSPCRCRYELRAGASDWFFHITGMPSHLSPLRRVFGALRVLHDCRRIVQTCSQLEILSSGDWQCPVRA